VSIDNSEQRLSYVIEITIRIRKLVLLNGNYLMDTPQNLTAQEVYAR